MADTLKQQLRSGARIVSYDSAFYRWAWDEREEHESAKGQVSNLYLWRIGESPRNDIGASGYVEKGRKSR